MASTAAIAILITVICLLVLTFLGLFLYQIFCGTRDDDTDIEAKPRRKKTPKKASHHIVHSEDRVDLTASKTEKKRQKEDMKRQKKEEKEFRKREKEALQQLEKDRRALEAVEMREKQNDVSKDTVLKMAGTYESIERDRQNRLSKISERSSKNSNHSDGWGNISSGRNFNYLAGNDDFAVAAKGNRGSSYSGSGLNIDKTNHRTSHQVARESSFRSERSGHSGIGSASMYSANTGTLNVGFDDDKSENTISRIDEELVSLRSGSSGLVRARASQWETASQVSSPRR